MSVVSQIATTHGGSVAWMPFLVYARLPARLRYSLRSPPASERHEGLADRDLNTLGLEAPLSAFVWQRSAYVEGGA